jgi:hypothetical protein
MRHKIKGDTMNVRTKFRALMIALALVIPMAMMPAAKAHAGIFISVGFAPPVLPVYAQPVCPGDGYFWTPGYWAYGDAGYYWVPGVWVQPPQVGVLWTPAWWGWEGGHYLFHTGYWGPHIGFYGGINYGFGYGGVGYEGGYWNGGHFFYNRAVGNYGGVHITNVYVHNVTIVNRSNVAFNGGQGGIQARANTSEMAAMHESHFQPTANQVQHQTFASQNRAQFASVNHGRPGVTAASTVGAYHSNPAGRPTVNERSANQQSRIAQGDRSGQLTERETAHADQKQANIDRTVSNDRQANGGRLTGQERQQVNHEQNNASKQIHNEKHNNATQPKAEDREKK